MNLDGFLLRQIFLALPGFVGSKVYRKLRGGTDKKNWEDFIEIFLFAVLSYLLLGIVTWGKIVELKVSYFINSENEINELAIALSAICSIILAYVLSYLNKVSLINYLGCKFSCTNRETDEDVWGYYFYIESEWILVRDHKTNLSYYGFVRYFSDSRNLRELILENANVYDSVTGRLIYNVKRVYLSRINDEITIQSGINHSVTKEDKG